MRCIPCVVFHVLYSIVFYALFLAIIQSKLFKNLVKIDGMDNKKSYIPRLLEKSKEMSGTERLASKISGCNIYSGWYEAKRKCLFYINHDQVLKREGGVQNNIAPKSCLKYFLVQ